MTTHTVIGSHAVEYDALLFEVHYGGETCEFSRSRLYKVTTACNVTGIVVYACNSPRGVPDSHASPRRGSSCAPAPRRSLARPLRRGGCHVSAVLAARTLCDLALVYSAWACILLAHGDGAVGCARSAWAGRPPGPRDRRGPRPTGPQPRRYGVYVCAQVGLLHRRFASAPLGARRVLSRASTATRRRERRGCRTSVLCARSCAVVAPMLSSASRPKTPSVPRSTDRRLHVAGSV